MNCTILKFEGSRFDPRPGTFLIGTLSPGRMKGGTQSPIGVDGSMIID